MHVQVCFLSKKIFISLFNLIGTNIDNIYSMIKF